MASCVEFASDPKFTYSQGPFQTTVDYVLSNPSCSFLISSCCTHEEHPLNTSDHLPVTTSLSVHKQTMPLTNNDPTRINWRKAIATGDVAEYKKVVEQKIAPLIGKTYNDPEEVNADLITVPRSWLAALQRPCQRDVRTTLNPGSTIPTCRPCAGKASIDGKHGRLLDVLPLATCIGRKQGEK